MKPIFITNVGSKLYGCQTHESDTDFKGFAFNEIDCLIGLGNQTQQQFTNNKIGREKIEGVIYDVKYFIQLCMKGNPTVIECAFADSSHHVLNTKTGLKVCDFVKNNFLTKSLFKPYSAYHRSQIKKLQNSVPVGYRKENFEKFGYDLKFCFHAFRLARQCAIVMTEGALRPTLDKSDINIGMDIRNGKFTKTQAIELLERVDVEMYDAYKNSRLPESLNYNKINEWLVELYSEYVSWNLHRNNKNRGYINCVRNYISNLFTPKIYDFDEIDGKIKTNDILNKVYTLTINDN